MWSEGTYKLVYRVDVRHVSHFLREVDIFRGLSERHLDRLAGLCEELSFKAGDFLGVQSEPGNMIYVIRRGEITVTTGSEDKTLLVRTVGEHETLLVGVLLEPPVLVTTAQAATDGEAFAIPRVRLLELCDLEPRIGMHVYSAVCGILMSRYQYALGRLRDSVGPEIQGDPSWKGAEV